MEIPSSNTPEPEDDSAFAPEDESVRMPRELGERWRLRLIIAIPTLLILFSLAQGFVSYQIVDAMAGKVQSLATKGEFVLAGERILIALLLFVVLSCASGLALAWYILHPIRNLTLLFQQVVRGQPTTKIKIPSRDEIGELGKSFNSLVDYLNDFIETRNRYILESFPGGLVTLNQIGEITAINSAAKNMLGDETMDFLGRPITSVLKRSAGENRNFLNQVGLALRGKFGHQNRRFSLKKSDGSWMDVAVSSTTLFDSAQKAIGAVLSLRDLSQVEALHRQLRLTDQLATIGSFAMGIAHEIRNPLASIKGVAQLLAEDGGQGEQQKAYCRRIIKETDRLDGVLRELLDFSQPSRTPKRPCDLSILMHESLQVARHKVGSERALPATITENYESLPLIQVPAERILQALVNVVQNALEAAPEDGEVRLSTKVSHVENEGDWISLLVYNTGESIPAQNLKRIFDPFFTTKENGTGLGLAISYQIVTQSGGFLEVQSVNGETSFDLRFPVVRAAADSLGENSAPDGAGEDRRTTDRRVKA